MKVVVTGATGHLGSYVVHRLAALGFEVVAASRSGAIPAPPYGAEPVPGVRGLAVDVSRDAAVAILATELGPEVALVHLAGWHPVATATTTSVERPQLLEVNVLGTMRVLEAARRSVAGVKAVIYASTFEVYGLPEQSGPVTESARLNPITDYGASKLSGEDHLFAFAYEERTRVVALRLPAIYGPGEHTPRALPNFLKAVAQGQRPKIYGDGGDLRDQIHGGDAALAVEKALASEAPGIFNIADGQEHSIRELAENALRVSGLGGEPEMLPVQRPRYDFHMSIDKARKELGFEPEVRLIDGMKEELDWLFKSQRAL